MTLWFKSEGQVRGNYRKTYAVPYEAINDSRFHWAEDYEKTPERQSSGIFISFQQSFQFEDVLTKLQK